MRSLIAKALEYEKQYKIQTYLEQARDAVSNMANAPQEPSYQTAFAEAFKNLKASIVSFSGTLSPAEWDQLDEISTKNEFSDVLINQIESVVAENAATPAVIRDKLTELASARSSELVSLNRLLTELVYYGFDYKNNQSDEAQIGFKIPRDIFNNNFARLINELNFLRKFVRFVSEAEGEDPDNIEVGTISTSDPLFWLIVAYGVAKTIGGVTDWCLDTWRRVEDIRHVRAQTAKLNSFDADEIEKIFGPKIEKEIEAAIKEKVDALTLNIGDQARKHEIQNGLRPALRQFLARIERGLTVDIRYLPPPKSDNDHEDVEQNREAKTAEIHDIAAKLVFPRPVGDPILRLEAANDDGAKAEPMEPST